ncbi:acetyl esterase/lipase [Luteibacter sp. Sphag1AF]|uniref:alpha/beta hydrolase n=1 Tax=Luteibacter sp. Sphag1AF TaxID=2587031 RepID=UPI00160C58D3|nr:alpha/beta hydrolase [Luteibacter sp. Sphag1AF]MBB3228695.1 acetyl esterase/lipase [Luteibacter sp. Sphag1AF]
MKVLPAVVAIACLSFIDVAVAHRNIETGGHHNETHVSQDQRREDCFDSSDPTQIPLWNESAPGATGNDACRDIPYLQVYVPQNETDKRMAAILIIPGGGYDRLTDEKEQAPVAQYFADTLHVKAFVLHYRLVQPDGTYRFPVPMWDGRRALNLLGHDARRFGINPQQIGLFGFSAGGHLASTLALHPDDDFHMPSQDNGGRTNIRAAFLGLGYPVISMLPDAYASPSSLKHLLYGYRGSELATLEHALSGQEHVTSALPPVFLFESMDDQRISPQNSVMFASALKDAGVPAEVHLFAHGVHGAGLAQGIPEEEAWPRMFRDWLARFFPTPP